MGLTSFGNCTSWNTLAADCPETTFYNSHMTLSDPHFRLLLHLIDSLSYCLLQYQLKGMFTSLDHTMLRDEKNTSLADPIFLEDKLICSLSESVHFYSC